MIARDINRNAATSRWSSTGIEHPRGRVLEKRHPSPNRYGHRQDSARHHGAALIRMVLAVTFETSPDQRLPLQSP